MSEILLWVPSHGRAKARRQARTYIQKLCADTGCHLEDQPDQYTIEKCGGRESGRSILMVRHDDDDGYSKFSPAECYLQGFQGGVLVV